MFQPTCPAEDDAYFSTTLDYGVSNYMRLSIPHAELPYSPMQVPEIT
jgi:hypothetical protein